MAVRKNEAGICEAVIRLLEEDTGGIRDDVRFPEVDGIGPPVECRFGLDGRRFAMEHTLVEPFTDQIRTGSEFHAFAAPIEAALNGSMPSPGTYTLQFPVHPTAGRHRRTHAALRERIIAWAREMGTELHGAAPHREDRTRHPHGYEGERSTEIDGLELTLRRRVHWSETGRHDSALFLVRSVGTDLEDLRLERITTALDRKLPKLSACRAEGDRTILVLEFADIALTNHVLIAQALEKALQGRDFPDFVVIVDAVFEDRWNVFFPVMNRVFSIDMEWIEVEPPIARPPQPEIVLPVHADPLQRRFSHHAPLEIAMRVVRWRPRR
ncbi:hypothetical protein [Sphingobium sp. LB126]|uniref:hypothetical protein n=1 Tax=Sphingobium sp. LB126 TaxID=1983755 RepID=UPI0012FD87C4|nr:hypothetical protein [Sphingobium sp. LB126]